MKKRAAMPAVAWDVVVPAAYWQEGAAYPPASAHRRTQRLNLYQDLYDGRGCDLAVRANYYRRTADFLASLLASFPPMVAGLADDAFTAAANAGLADAAHALGLDQTRYGTCILRASGNMDGDPWIQDLDPRAWFPTDERNHDVWVQFKADLGDGPTEIHIQRMSPEAWRTDVHAYADGQIGRWLRAASAPGTGERVSLPLPAPPSDLGNWGTAMFDDMAPLVAELARRATQTSGMLDMHASPVLSVTREPTSMPQIMVPGQDANRTVELVYLQGLREQPTMVLPDGFSDARYVVWDAQLQGAFQHVRHIEDALFSATGIPAALYAADRSALASGTALKRVFAPTYVRMHDVQRRARPVLLKLVHQLGMQMGVDTAAAAIEWDNPLDALDTQTVVQTSEDPEEDEPDAGLVQPAD